ncbi:MAG TPA: DUF1684 domain-containing protein [Thermoanaerobaculia bacterium]|nr:DUF1684 domain-containing protein [Thermoanaerobaculia bacterium]
MNGRFRRALLLGTLLLAALIPGCRSEPETPAVAEPERVAPLVDEAYAEEITGWQKKRAENLQRETGWLTVSGLYWLDEGANTLGSSPESDIILPEGKAPASSGVVTRKGDRITLVTTEESGITSDGAKVTTLELRADVAEDGPTMLEIGPVSFHVISRGDRLGIRIRDKESEARKKFQGLDYYPIDPKWNIEARFERYDPPKTIPIVNVLNMVDDNLSPGAIVFEIDGTTHRIDPIVEEGSTDWFVMFADTTNGAETYGAGRYLYTAPAENGKVRIDFNKAYNPPCAFTAFATCPLPPKQNRLPVRVAAGEKKYEGLEAGKPAH